MDIKTALALKALLATVGLVGVIVLVALGKAPLEAITTAVVALSSVLVGGVAVIQAAHGLGAAIRSTSVPTTTTTTAIAGGEQIASITTTEATAPRKEP